MNEVFQLGRSFQWFSVRIPVSPLAAIAIGLLIVSLNGCASTRNRGTVTRAAGAKEVFEILSNRSPAGISIDDATSFMTAEGFECSLERSSHFTAKTGNRDGSVTESKRGPIDFIHCARRTRNGLVETSLAIALIVENGQVTEALDNRSLYGP